MSPETRSERTVAAADDVEARRELFQIHERQIALESLFWTTVSEGTETAVSAEALFFCALFALFLS
jgi:hypothetical protein